MASHKALKSVSHNFSHSFISLMNYVDDDYFLGHLLKQARQKKLDTLEIDILENTAQPDKLLTIPIRESIEHWNKWFSTLVESSGSAMDFVKSATMMIQFNLSSKQYGSSSDIVESYFVCEIKIIDDRGKQYRYKHTGWWHPET